jgi:hypothetical protein
VLARAVISRKGPRRPIHKTKEKKEKEKKGKGKGKNKIRAVKGST